MRRSRVRKKPALCRLVQRYMLMTLLVTTIRVRLMMKDERARHTRRSLSNRRSPSDVGKRRVYTQPQAKQAQMRACRAAVPITNTRKVVKKVWLGVMQLT